MTSELMRPATRDGHYLVRGEVVRLTRQIAYAQASVTNEAMSSSAVRRALPGAPRDLDVLGGDLT